MKNSVTGTTSGHRDIKNKNTPPKKEDADKEEVVIILINGLNSLIAMANSTDMGTAAKIFYTAKEELVHWAVNMNFHESAKDRFINNHLYKDTDIMTVAKDFAAKTDTDSLKQLIKAIEQHVKVQSYKIL